MSELGRLFRWRSTTSIKPLENFTTEALAIAIGYDPRPIKVALDKVACVGEDAGTAQKLATIRSIAATGTAYHLETQRWLRRSGSVRSGYLDLVLMPLEGAWPEIWVEVKVDAWESGDQLEIYQRHAESFSPSPIVLTLGRFPVKPGVPFLTWSQVLDGIVAVADPDPAWQRLRAFIIEKEVVILGPGPSEPVDRDACIRVLLDVNDRVSETWPGRGWLAWRKGQLRHSLEKFGVVVATSGPLRYGLMPTGGGWGWGLVVTTARNWANVKLDPDEMLQDAKAAGLGAEWRLNAGSDTVLERHLAPTLARTHESIVAWYVDGLCQLRNAEIIERYFAAIAKKKSAVQAVEMGQGPQA